MGRAAGELADRILLTEDDPAPGGRGYLPGRGAVYRRQGRDYTVEPDRERAVERAILQAVRPAVVLLAGKGCEVFQKRKTAPSPVCPTGSWPAGPWPVRRDMSRLDDAFRAGGAAAWAGVSYAALLPWMGEHAQARVQTLCPGASTVLVAAFPY